MEHKEIGDIEAMLSELKDDITVPKNVRLKVERVMKVLNDDIKMDIKVSKALNELEEIADDVNLQSYTRTQVWNVISALEKIK
ncbi:MAG: UPF0147 family protein [Candidatus Woesearchaeota archaeon]|jgi:hypothetical protein|nr:hypothetical protein [Candidatus Woesearchaeota archaeon]MDP6647816.1 UPF0147 family protein [Candidatus Woesearchaeota archaeon]|tara:strand:+ start:68 stop:316 length:249 start_codon:yes stop_codon:yes gene_type:complete